MSSDIRGALVLLWTLVCFAGGAIGHEFDMFNNYTESGKTEISGLYSKVECKPVMK